MAVLDVISRYTLTYLGCDVAAYIVWVKGHAHTFINSVLSEAERGLVILSAETRLRLLALSPKLISTHVLIRTLEWIDA